jgi:glucosamine kinase
LKEEIVIGVDGGGTSTRVAIATTSGILLGLGQAGAGNYHDVGVEQVQSHIEQALIQAWAAAGHPQRQAAAAFLGLGSITSEEDRQVVQQIACKLSLARLVGVDHDLSVALAGGLAGEPGIVLIAGTGSSSFGCCPDGRTWRAGGWGHTLDDIGSSGWLGLQAMIATVRAFDGRGDSTVLSEQVLEALGIDDIQKIMRRVDGEGMTRREIAGLAPLVTQAAALGDRVAQEILTIGVGQLALLPATVAKQLNLVEIMGTVPIVVTGGLTKAGPVFENALDAALHEVLPEAVVSSPKFQPVIGAVLRAMELLDSGPSSLVVNNLFASHAMCCA